MVERARLERAKVRRTTSFTEKGNCHYTTTPKWYAAQELNLPSWCVGPVHEPICQQHVVLHEFQNGNSYKLRYISQLQPPTVSMQHYNFFLYQILLLTHLHDENLERQDIYYIHTYNNIHQTFLQVLVS